MPDTDPTAWGRWEAALKQAWPAPALLPLQNAHLIGPFDHAEWRGFRTAYPPEGKIDLTASYPGKRGTVRWQRMPGLDSDFKQPLDFGAWMPTDKESVLYLYAEIEAPEAQIASLAVGSQAAVRAWFNGQAILWPTIPFPANPQDDRALVALQPGTNLLLLKLLFDGDRWGLECRCEAYGPPGKAVQGLKKLVAGAPDGVTRLVARFHLAEAYAALGQTKDCQRALQAIRQDPLATRWDVAWADAAQDQYDRTGSFLPVHDVPVSFQPVTGVAAYETFWPQSPPPAPELLVLDVSAAAPELEFAMSVLQGLVNRRQPRLYLLHSRYARQDGQWLDELHAEGYTSRRVTASEVWKAFGGEIAGALIYDRQIMDEIGAFHSAHLNQTNLLLMLGALREAVPLTPEMNQELGLPVLFDARGQWGSQYEMMRWAYVELFPHMNQRILATNYPGIFLLTDYLVAFQVFTFWFPEHRTLPEENLLRGILASTPPNTPIVGWWFDWMPDPKEFVKDPEQRHADAVMEVPGLLRGSFFGKVLTPSHEATNLSVHSGVPVQPYRHQAPERPALDPGKAYYTFVISDGDNLGEALMMRTRDLQWDRPERGSFPMGWSFAPAASRMAPPVLNYYLRTATANDLLVGGLGVGYTEPIIYLRAYPEQREALYAAYARQTDQALGWIDTTCLWLINGTAEEEDRYARGSSGRLQGIFTGYGGSPEVAAARIGPHQVVAFRPATRFAHGKPQEELIQGMVDDIRQAASARPDFVEAWVLNWGWTMDMLQEVQRRLGPEFVCVRPDVLVALRQQAGNNGKE